MAPEPTVARDRLDEVERGLDAIESTLARLDAGVVDDVEPAPPDEVDPAQPDEVDPAQPDEVDPALPDTFAPDEPSGRSASL